MPSINSPTQVATVAAHERTNSQVTPMNIPVSFDPIDEDTIYTIVAEELDTGKTDKGLWTRLFAECGGDEKQVKVLYINRRAEKLLKSEKARVEQLAFEEAHRQRQLALDAEKAEQIRRQKAGLADSRLIAAVVDGNWSSAAQLLEGGVSPFGATDDGIKLAALAIKRGDQQMVNLLRSHEIKSMEPQVVAVVDKFHAGTDLSIDEVTSLVDASAKHADFVMMRSASTGYTLLHWCGRLGLDKSVDVMLDRGANAAAFCDAGKQAHHLTRSTALANRLAAAVNAVP
jgi:hypothetical protein